MKKTRKIKNITRLLMFCFAYELVFPNVASALTSGPTQPEVQSFEPVGTTDMVDLFTGDFVYNIPLADVEGYPINISYHSGVTVEQEASWVGLGWNINPGVINRAVRGLPDDLNGETIEKQLNIKPEKNVKVSASGCMEIFGSGLLNLSAGFYATFNNYRGMGVGFQTGLNASLFGFASAGVNLGISSQNGADIDYSAGFGFSSSNSVSRDFCAGIGVNASSGYNTINGAKDVSINVSANYKTQFDGKRISGGGSVYSTSIPIGLQNYVPVITNKSTLNGWAASIGAGAEFFGLYMYGFVGLEMAKLEFDKNGNRRGYGYMYLENAVQNDIVDFTRDKDGMFNKTMRYLPPATTTYDVYSVSGQGSGGIFRPVRNDNGYVFDPKMSSSNTDIGLGFEGGFGNLFEFGINFSIYSTQSKAGHVPNGYRSFTHRKKGSLYENVFFKQAGELTESRSEFFDSVGNLNPIIINENNTLPAKRFGSESRRDPRGNVFYHLTATEAATADWSFSTQKIENYTDVTSGLKHGPSTAKSLINRNDNNRRGNQMSEIIQVNKDGSRYVYGLPAMNNLQNEVTFSTMSSPNSDGTVNVNGNDNINNSQGLENYYSRTVTPSYAHSYMLTNVLSTDYVDITGNGPSDDDLGTYVKFNYSLKAGDYRWRSPYNSSVAQHSPGFYCRPKDDKASYVVGSKEQWYLHSMETKNFVAEFYTSAREDGKGATGRVVPLGSLYSGTGNVYANTANAANSFKLDSFKLYNKHDRFINQDNAVPVKTVYFEYDYALCTGTPNSTAGNGGKLTLKKIYMKYGNSEKNLLSPYQFSYSSFNPSYGINLKDRWGNYKPNNSAAPNFEFPYVDQDANNDQFASAWSLNKITLPSGGEISIEYESDDYAYVQDKRAMEMFQVEGAGPFEHYFPLGSLGIAQFFPFNYIYFKRRIGSEIGSVATAYQPGSIIYYNFNVKLLKSSDKKDFVKGYAEVESVGTCPNNSDYGYIKLKPKMPNGSSNILNPIRYTAINMARYYMPNEMYNGYNPDQSQLRNAMRGMIRAIGQLLGIFKNPIEYFAKRDYGNQFDIQRSFVRLCSPNLKKKGGGSRVKQIKINDSWNSMTGGDNATGEYGNSYNYTKEYGSSEISSGVASYEPLIGGDENPLKKPANYIATYGSKFPPNDPMELYQEEPVGESFYPSPVVGYSKVTVKNIHRDKARSAQTEDEYEFFTAKDYPLRVIYTPAQLNEQNQHSFFHTQKSMKATQGYTIIMNDMHGKLKEVKNYLIKGTEKSIVNRQIYSYSTSGTALNNNATVLDYSSTNNTMSERSAVLGQDMDITVDSRNKEEHITVFQLQTNLNCFLVLFIPVPIPTFFMKFAMHDRYFNSMVTTKVVQQYGILRSVKTIKEGAAYTAENKLYDPESGEVLLTKVNNDFNDAKYETSFPAYWAYRGMGPTYRNILFEDKFKFKAGPNGMLTEWAMGTDNPHMYQTGDEIVITSNDLPGGFFMKKCWVVNNNYAPILAARWGDLIPSTILSQVGTDIIHKVFYAKIIRSGYRNMLSAPMQTTTSLDYPQTGTPNIFKTTKTISTAVTTYSDALVNLLPWHTAINNDTNNYIHGYRGNYRVAKKVTYLADRDYSFNHARYNGSFPINMGYWQMNPISYNNNEGRVVINPASVIPGVNSPWKNAQDVVAYNVWGNEIENKDALSISSAAQFGFNHLLPVAVGVNAKSHEILSEGFEDFRILYLQPWAFNFSPFKDLFVWATVPTPLNPYKYYDVSGSGIQLLATESHTGTYSLMVGSGPVQIPLGSTNPLDNNRLNKFCFTKYKKYIVSCWVRGNTTQPQINIVQQDGSNAQVASDMLAVKSNKIDGWQLYEKEVIINGNAEKVRIDLPGFHNYDDFRIYPADGNMKAFVYSPINQKLISTLDENNFATFYEYDNEGQLIRINKETERGIMTVQESRSATVKP